MLGFFLKWGAPLTLGLFLTTAALSGEPPTACDSLGASMAAMPKEPVFLPSYPTVDAGPLHDAAYLYDNAVAAIALVGCHRTDQAARIGEAILIALDHDRFWHDGRLRNAYLAGPADDRPLKLPGWWSKDQGRWLEDRYQVGSDSGNMAWAMLALLTLDKAGAGRGFALGAERIGHWIDGLRDDRGNGGFTGGTFGHEPSPEAVRWKSTEHNTDLAAAFRRLSEATGNDDWRRRADQAEAFVHAMWDETRGYYATGTGEDGRSENPVLALDAQVWPLLAIEGENGRTDDVLTILGERLSVDGGYAYGEARDGLWTEGSAQAALLTELTGRPAETILSAIARQRAPDGSFYATSTGSLPTGFMLPTDPTKPRLYFRLPHLGATAWVALAERRFNPFTGTADLP